MPQRSRFPPRCPAQFVALDEQLGESRERDNVRKLHGSIRADLIRIATVARLYEEMNRFQIGRLFLVGHLGAIEIPREMLPQIVADGLTSRVEPDRTSPWVLSVPRQGIGLLHANPGGKRRRDGTRGRVFIPWSGSRQGCLSLGTTKARKMYRGVRR